MNYTEEVSKTNFGDSFAWGVANAAYQVEGAFLSDGKGLSVWDTFCQDKKKKLKGQNGNIACDFYNRYAEDIMLMRQMNIGHFRFSIAWARIFPQGIGAINLQGINFYNRVIDFCLEMNITPWITLYHWDLPAKLQKKGGWTNRDVVRWFEQYVECCVKHFGDRVKNWMVLNEPMVFTGAGYFLGVHAPGKMGLSNFLSAAHHASLCQAEGARIIRSLCKGANIGTTFSYSHIEPFREHPADIRAAQKVDTILNRLFIEPLLGMGYPTKDAPVLKKIEKYMKEGDEARLKFDMDFIGLQIYTRELVRHSWFTPYVQARIISAAKRNVPHTQMNWEVYPSAIKEALHRLNKYEGIKKIIVTENGAAFPDIVQDNQIHDEHRKEYIRQHIQQVGIAKQEGVPVEGYFVWTFTDNFEWAEGYRPRFGLVHVDFGTQRRIIKDSGHWYAAFLQQN